MAKSNKYRELSKKDIIEYLRQEGFVLYKKDAIMITNAIFDYLRDQLIASLKKGEDVRISIKGFWNFFTYTKPGQKKWFPTTQDYQQTPTRRIVKFKRSKLLSHPQSKY